MSVEIGGNTSTNYSEVWHRQDITLYRGFILFKYYYLTVAADCLLFLVPFLYTSHSLPPFHLFEKSNQVDKSLTSNTELCQNAF